MKTAGPPRVVRLSDGPPYTGLGRWFADSLIVGEAVIGPASPPMTAGTEA